MECNIDHKAVIEPVEDLRIREPIRPDIEALTPYIQQRYDAGYKGEETYAPTFGYAKRLAGPALVNQCFCRKAAKKRITQCVDGESQVRAVDHMIESKRSRKDVLIRAILTDSRSLDP